MSENTLYNQLAKKHTYTSKYATIKINSELLSEIKNVASELGHGSQYGKVLDAIIQSGLNQLKKEMQDI